MGFPEKGLAMIIVTMPAESNFCAKAYLLLETPVFGQ